MTRDQLDDVTITTGDEFKTALTGVVEAALENGVDVRGAWEFPTTESTNDLEVKISELATDDSE